MPISDQKIIVAQPAERIDFDAVKLQAKKVIVPTATDTHGTQVQTVSPLANGSTEVVVRVHT